MFQQVENYADLLKLAEDLMDKDKESSRENEYKRELEENRASSLLEAKFKKILSAIEPFFTNELNLCQYKAENNPTQADKDYILNFVDCFEKLLQAFKSDKIRNDFLELAMPNTDSDIRNAIFQNPNLIKNLVSNTLMTLQKACEQSYSLEGDDKFFIDKLINSPTMLSGLELGDEEIIIDFTDIGELLLKCKSFGGVNHKYVDLAIIVNDIRKSTFIENKERVVSFITSVMYSDILQSIPKDNKFYSRLHEVKNTFLHNSFDKMSEDDKSKYYEKLSDLAAEYSFGIESSTKKFNSEIKDFHNELPKGSDGVAIGSADSLNIFISGNIIYVINQHSTCNKSSERANFQMYRSHMAIKNDLECSSEESKIKKAITEKFGINVNDFVVKQGSIQILDRGINSLPKFFENPHHKTQQLLNVAGYFSDALRYANGLRQELRDNTNCEFINNFLELVREVRRKDNSHELAQDLIYANLKEGVINPYNVLMDLLVNTSKVFTKDYVDESFFENNDIRVAQTDIFSKVFAQPFMDLVSILSIYNLNNSDKKKFYAFVADNADILLSIAKLTGDDAVNNINKIFSKMGQRFLSLEDSQIDAIEAGDYNKADLFQKFKDNDFGDRHVPTYDIDSIKITNKKRFSHLSKEECVELKNTIFNFAKKNGATNELVAFVDVVIDQFVKNKITSQITREPVRLKKDLAKLFKLAIPYLQNGNEPDFKDFIFSITQNSGTIYKYEDDPKNLAGLRSYVTQSQGTLASKNLERLFTAFGFKNINLRDICSTDKAEELLQKKNSLR